MGWASHSPKGLSQNPGWPGGGLAPAPARRREPTASRPAGTRGGWGQTIKRAGAPACGGGP